MKQIRVEKHVAGGGGGAIYTATLTDPILKEANGGKEVVAVKEMQNVDKLSDEENAALFKQEVSVMAYVPTFELIFASKILEIRSFFAFFPQCLDDSSQCGQVDRVL